MGKLVTPETYLIGYTCMDMNGMDQYLKASGNEDFADTITAATASGLSQGEALTSFYAKRKLWSAYRGRPCI